MRWMFSVPIVARYGTLVHHQNSDLSVVSSEVKRLFTKGQTQQALKLLGFMQRQGLYLESDETYVYLLRHCTATKSEDEGRLLHAHILKSYEELSPILSYTIFCMYSKFGCLEDTRREFEHLSLRNVVAWTSIINEYASHGSALEAICLYHRMTNEGVSPNHVTSLCVLKACSKARALIWGKHVHAHVLMSTFQTDADTSLGNALIDMYAKCGDIQVAQYEFNRLVTRNVVSWNSLIAGFVNNKKFDDVLELFSEMEVGGVGSDTVTYLSILKACAGMKDLFHGKLAHCGILKRGFETIAYIGNSIVDMYCKCQSLDDARRAFLLLQKPQIEAWNALIAGCAELGHPEEALRLFDAMKVQRLEPGKVTFLSVLKACSTLVASDLGCQIHSLIREKGFESDLFVATNLIDLHAKCGNMEKAKKLFDRMSSRSLFTWNIIIAGYALHGQADESFVIFSRMKKEGIGFNHITLVGLLSGCSHGGFVEQGCQIFQSVIELYSYQLLMEHYCCIVDILGRAGRLEEALCVIKEMPFEPNSAVWKALLGACKICNGTDLAKCIAECLELNDNGAYVLLSNICAAGNEWEGIAVD